MAQCLMASWSRDIIWNKDGDDEGGGGERGREEKLSLTASQLPPQ